MCFRFEHSQVVLSLLAIKFIMTQRIIIISFAIILIAASGFGQGTTADYERSAKIRQLFSGKVYKETIKPHWFGGHHFWYETEMRGEREYVLVNGSKGKRRVFSNKEEFDEVLKRRKSRAEKLVKKELEKNQVDSKEASSKSRTNSIKNGPISPNGRWRAFIKDHNLFVHDLMDGADIQLSKDGTNQHAYQQPFFWSPDSKYIALMKRREVKSRQVHYVDSAPDDQLQQKILNNDWKFMHFV